MQISNQIIINLKLISYLLIFNNHFITFLHHIYTTLHYFNYSNIHFTTTLPRRPSFLGPKKHPIRKSDNQYK